VELYVGSLAKADAVAGKQVLTWTVIAPTRTRVALGALAQNYRISTAASVLIGESSAIALQSERPDGHDGVTEFKLTLAAMPV
jgi:hypothetical protein